MMPQQKPGTSKQDYETPRDFLEAVEHKFNLTLNFDLAIIAHVDSNLIWHNTWEGPILEQFFLDQPIWLPPDWVDTLRPKHPFLID